MASDCIVVILISLVIFEVMISFFDRERKK